MTGSLPSLFSALAALPEQRRKTLRIPASLARAAVEQARAAAEPDRAASAQNRLPPQIAAAPPAATAPAPQNLPLSVPAFHVTATPRPPAHTPPAPQPNRPQRLAALREQVLPCVICPHLAATRRSVVFGTGNPEAELMFVGEAPGADEDAQGEPFVGAAGRLLTKIIEAMALSRDRVYIANVLKCRPDMPPGSTGNRPPRKEEMAACLPYLLEQIRIIAPRCIVALGSTAVCGLFGLPEVRMAAERGRWRLLPLGGGASVPVMVTYHPAYLLRNQSLSEKRKVWDDMLAVLEHLGHPISARQRAYFQTPGR